MRKIIFFLLSLNLVIFFGQSVYATSYHVYPEDDLAYTVTQNTCSWDIVYIHEGVHVLSDDVNISGKSLPIVGDGSENTIIILEDHVFRTYKTQNNLNPMIVTISGITFKNAKTKESIVFENYLPNTSLNIVLSDCKFQNVGDVVLISGLYPVRDYKETMNRCDIFYGESSSPEIVNTSTIDDSPRYDSINLEINNSSFSNSSSLTAYSFSPESSIYLQIENSVFLDNNNSIQIFGPVGLYSKNNLFSNNLKGVIIDSVNSKGILINNTVDSNGHGTGFGIYNKGTIELQNNIISNNNYGIYNEGRIIQHKNILWENKINYGIIDSDFMIYDPLFTIGPRGTYYLKEESKAVDAGTDSSSLFTLNRKTTRVDGVFDKGTVDIGYHYDSNQKSSLFARLIEYFLGLVR
jgi:hypothetical protein